MLEFLDNPLIFNIVRGLIAGKQENSKNFVRKNIEKFRCKRVLDVCCGTGDFAECVKSGEYLGIDNSINYIKFAASKYPDSENKKFLLFDVTKKTLSSDYKYDCALLISTLHHFSDKELDKLFNDLKKVISGILIVADLDANPPGLLRRIMVKLDRGKYIRTNSKKLQLLKKYFKILSTRTIPSRLAIQYGVVCQA